MLKFNKFDAYEKRIKPSFEHWLSVFLRLLNNKNQAFVSGCRVELTNTVLKICEETLVPSQPSPEILSTTVEIMLHKQVLNAMYEEIEAAQYD